MRDNTREPRPPRTADDGAMPDGHAALEFANTVAWHAGASPVERLGDYAAYLAWARGRALVTPAEADALARAAASHAAAASAYGRAVAFREAFYRVASAVAHGRPAGAADLGGVRAAWADALAHARLVQEPGDPARLALAWPVSPDAADPAPLDVVRWRLAHAAGALLTAGPLERLRECANHPCGWLFVDRSRNRSRRWCDSADCGNRVRVREHLARRRAARATHSACPTTADSSSASPTP